ncbi:MAG TPA: UPF0149 family protein [Usitatibacter sp.]|nr:UPF0149 family protein [Usitatibacter sp.]
MPAQFPDSDLDRLEAWLNADERIDHTLAVDAVQGLLAAVTSGPQQLPIETWLPEVIGRDQSFASAQEEREIRDLLTRFAQDTARQLNEAEGFDFVLYGAEGDDEDLASWAEGYLIGVDLADPPWDEEADAEDLDNMLFPFLALTGQAKQLALDAGEEWMEQEDEARLLREVREGLASHLLDVREYWFNKSIPGTVRREGPRIGRNDPCPCGSGKKYKNCHGTGP